jgi:hypothetical protein
MVKRREGRFRHENKIEELTEIWKRDGAKIINLRGKSPDLIIFQDNKAICIEVLTTESSWTYKGKKTVYEDLGFDEIQIFSLSKKDPEKCKVRVLKYDNDKGWGFGI